MRDGFEGSAWKPVRNTCGLTDQDFARLGTVMKMYRLSGPRSTATLSIDGAEARRDHNRGDRPRPSHRC